MKTDSPGQPVVLRDRNAGTEAHVLAGVGFNCYRFQARLQERTFEVLDRKSTRLNSSHIQKSRMPSSA